MKRVALALALALVAAALLVGVRDDHETTRVDVDRPHVARPASSDARSRHAATSAHDASRTRESTLARVTRARRPHDLLLLAELARARADADADAAIQRLLALRDAGAATATLDEYVARELHGLRVHVAARRWLARERGEPPLRSHLGEGGGRMKLRIVRSPEGS